MDKLTGVKILCNYPDSEAEAAITSTMTIEQLCYTLRKLAETEPDCTSFVVTAAFDRKD